MMWVVLAVGTFLAFLEPALMIIILTPVALYYIWNYNKRIKQLEERLNGSTSPSEGTQST